MTRVETMKASKHKIIVAEDAIQAYERLTGFIGLGEFFEEKGVWTIQRSEDSPCS